MQDLARRIAVGAATLSTLSVCVAACAPALAAAPREPERVDTPPPADAPAAPGGQDPLYGPVPFVESEPLLAEMRHLLEAPGTSKKALAVGLADLRDWLARPRTDPLARPTGQWLEARLLTAMGHKAEARAAWESLATTAGPFSDDARGLLADLAERARDPAGAAHWRLTRAPWSPGFLEGAAKSAKALERLGQGERAIELLDGALLQGMDPRTRTELVLLLADLHRAAKHAERARDLLLQTWWNAADGDPHLAKALRSLQASPSPALEDFRAALWASRGEAAKRLAGDKRKSTRKERAAGPIAQATRALLLRWDDGDALVALGALPEATKKGLDDDERAVLALTRGMLLRKLDRDEEAVRAFLAIDAELPAHPLAHEARDQAATLLRALGREREADPLDRAILEHAVPGERHRAALWRLGFSAVLARDGARASDYLRALEWRHGGDPDRHSFCWFERARYWRARAAQLEGDADTAKSLWTSLIQRYPAGWYALVARARLGAPAPGKVARRDDSASDVRGWDVAPDDPMATALALFRLGEERLAQDHFEALLDADQLPGNGRRLLSDLYDLAGDATKAARTLKHAAIPPTMPGDDPDEAYYDWYPLRYEEALADAARQNNLPSSLLAGVVSVETRFSASAKSHAGAVGAAQLLRTTGTAVGRKVYGKDFDARTLMEPEVNLAVAARYLADLVERFQGHLALAVAAYNAGPAPVQRWLDARGRLELDAFVETIPFEQARRYVMRVLSDAEIYRRLYGLDGHPLPLPLALDRAARR